MEPQQVTETRGFAQQRFRINSRSFSQLRKEVCKESVRYNLIDRIVGVPKKGCAEYPSPALWNPALEIGVFEFGPGGYLCTALESLEGDILDYLRK